ncbi:MAG: flippase-like domain-containing protein, partial [candidate division KSB1 bacterium]|nr:flippase-like domain-containing protein [candidate division KSB1 bacterium]
MATPLINSATYAYRISTLLKKLIPIVFIGLMLNVFFSFVWHDADLLAVTVNFSTPYFVVAVLLVILPWFANAMRLYIWTRFFGLKLSFTETFSIVVMGEFGAAITPSAVGSGPVKIGLLIHKKLSTGAALSIATLTTLEDLAFFVPAIPLALTLAAAWDMPFMRIFYDNLQANLSGVGIGVVSLITIILLLHKFWPKNNKGREDSTSGSPSFWERRIAHGKKILNEFIIALAMIQQRGKARFFATTLLSGIQWICRYSIITAIAASLGIHAHPILFFVLQWIIFTITVFSPT